MSVLEIDIYLELENVKWVREILWIVDTDVSNKTSVKIELEISRDLNKAII